MKNLRKVFFDTLAFNDFLEHTGWHYAISRFLTLRVLTICFNEISTCLTVTAGSTQKMTRDSFQFFFTFLRKKYNWEHLPHTDSQV